MSRSTVSTEQIDAVLPQTQCGLCSYDGCLPYAKAISTKGEALTLCPPGGVEGLHKLGKLLGEDVDPYLDSMRLKEKPPLLASIREHECIGCTKCIQACPVDAIIGAGKVMHTVIKDECTGCELCVEPCPVDCIDLIEIEATPNRADQYRDRYRARNQRLAKESIEKAKRHMLAKQAYQENKNHDVSKDAKRAAVREAILRSKQARGQ